VKEANKISQEGHISLGVAKTWVLRRYKKKKEWEKLVKGCLGGREPRMTKGDKRRGGKGKGGGGDCLGRGVLSVCQG